MHLCSRVSGGAARPAGGTRGQSWGQGDLGFVSKLHPPGAPREGGLERWELGWGSCRGGALTPGWGQEQPRARERRPRDPPSLPGDPGEGAAGARHPGLHFWCAAPLAGSGIWVPKRAGSWMGTRHRRPHCGRRGAGRGRDPGVQGARPALGSAGARESHPAPRRRRARARQKLAAGKEVGATARAEAGARAEAEPGSRGAAGGVGAAGGSAEPRSPALQGEAVPGGPPPLPRTLWAEWGGHEARLSPHTHTHCSGTAAEGGREWLQPCSPLRHARTKARMDARTHARTLDSMGVGRH